MIFFLQKEAKKLSNESVEENIPRKRNLKKLIKDVLKDPLKFYGFSFLIFSGLTLIFYFATSSVPLRAGAFMIAVFMGIMCRQQMKTEMRMYNDR